MLVREVVVKLDHAISEVLENFQEANSELFSKHFGYTEQYKYHRESEKRGLREIQLTWY